MVTLGGVIALCEKLCNVESFDVIENVIRALGKVVFENAYSILTANGFLYLLQIIDFFDVVKQKNILNLLINATKYISAPTNIETYIAPAISHLTGVIKYRDNKTKEILELVIILYRTICDSINRLYDLSPVNIPKLKKDYELLVTNDLLDNFFEIVVAGANSEAYLALTNKIWQSLMIILRYLCKFSPKICKYFINHGIFNIIQSMLATNPQKQTDESIRIRIQEINESVILLLDAILPQKNLIITEGKEKDIEAGRLILETEKETILSEQGNIITVLSQAVLPQVIEIYDESAALSTKFFCSQIIDKLCYRCPDSILVKVLGSHANAFFIYDNLSSSEPIFVCFGLKLCEMILQKLSKIYIRELKREGVFEIVKKLNDFEYFKAKYGQIGRAHV